MNRTSGLRSAEPGQQLAQRGEGPPPQLLRVGRSRGGAAGHRRRPRPAAGRGRPAPAARCRAAGGPRPPAGQAAQVAAQGVDQAVEGLVGDRLLLVAAALQDDHVPAPGQVVEEVLDQGALARARPAVDEGGGRPPLPGRLERVGQGGQVRLAAEEGPALRRGRRPGDLDSPASQPSRRSTSCPVGRASGVPAEQVDAERARSSGRPRRPAGGAGGSNICFAVITSSRVPGKGSRPVRAS